METNTELYHHGVLGMKWGHHKSGLELARDSYKRKASIEFSKSMLSATKAKNARAKYVNPAYYINKAKQKNRRSKYNKYKKLEKAAQWQIDNNDPIGKFFKYSGKAVDKGLEWVAKNPDKAQTNLDSFIKKYATQEEQED